MVKKSASSPAIIVLVYHRVDDIDTDPWGICVAPKIFEEQIQFLKNNFHIITAEEAVRLLTISNITEDSVCITFDDGYADNYLNALPVLEKYNCPATFFIATAFTGANAFWWDELELALLHSKKLPGSITLETNGNNYEYTNSTIELTEEAWQQHINWQWYEAPPTGRCAMFLQIWDRLRSLSPDEIKNNIASIKKLTDSNTALDRLPLNDQQLRKMSEHTLCHINMHTHTHPDLHGKEKHLQLAEMISCKQRLKMTYGINSNCLSYPYGRYDNNSIRAAKGLGMAGCFTTTALSINAGSSPYELGRYQVGNWNSIIFKNKLQSWKKCNRLK